MNETTRTTMSDLSKDEQLFADVIIGVVTRKHEKNKREYEK